MMEPTVQQRAGNDVALAKANIANNIYIPTSGSGTITGGLAPYAPYPNVCSGCGRCKDCGNPYQYPYTPYQVPYSQPQPQPYWGQPSITCANTA